MQRSKICMTIAGSDSSAGAGLQADLKTFAAHGCYGMSVVTASTAQNNHSISDIVYLPAKHVAAQFHALNDHYEISAIKLGMLGSLEIVDLMANLLAEIHPVPIVIDPVLSASCQGSLNIEQLAKGYTDKLLPLATMITPNYLEAKQMFATDQPSLVEIIQDCANSHFTHILVKGGHGNIEPNNEINMVCDTLFSPNGKALNHFKHPHIATVNTHGTGCTLASAIASNMANGQTAIEAVTNAQSYVQRILKGSVGFLSKQHPNNSTNLPMDHFL